MRTALAYLCTASLALTTTAHADLDAVGPVPAATLLIPYFQVDVSDQACAGSDGATTLVSVNNAGKLPTLAHLTFWTDQGIPALWFDIYLTGYDVQTFNLRDVFCLGDLPSTGFAVSHQGALSSPNVAFEGCNNTTTPGAGPVWFPDEAINSTFRAHLKAWLTGNESPSTHNCAGSGQLGDHVAVGYVTIDQGERCSETHPANPAYFSSGSLGFRNVLWGDFILVDPANDFSQGFTAVPIEAKDPNGPEAFAPGQHTFYGRYVGASASDQREPLGTTTAARFATGGAFDATTFYVWREGNQQASAYFCNLPGPSSWYPLGLGNPSGVGAIAIFDERENFLEPAQGPSALEPPTSVAPNQTNAVSVGPGQLYDTGSFHFGWIYQNLQSTAVSAIYGEGDVAAQQYTLVALSAAGRYSVGLDGFQLDSANDAIVANPFYR